MRPSILSLLGTILLSGLLAFPLLATAQGSTLFLPSLQHDATLPQPLPQAHIIAWVPDGYASKDADEAFAIQNTGHVPLLLGGWRITDGEGTINLPDLVLNPGQRAWCARQARAFRQVWGWLPQCEYHQDTDPQVPNATGTAPYFNNRGDSIQLMRQDGTIMDAVMFGRSHETIAGWTGAPLQPYTPTSAFPREGQVYYRLFHPDTGLPLADSDTAQDWAQGNQDPLLGRRTAYPGWDLYRLSQPLHIHWSQPPRIQLGILPDAGYASLEAILRAAAQRIDIEAYELTHPQLVQLLASKIQEGVQVHILLEGGPVGGITDAHRWAAMRLAQAGAQIHFMVDRPPDAHDRYPFLHTKFLVIDQHTLLISTENFKRTSFPVLASTPRTWGRRGYWLRMDDAALAQRASTIFQQDAEPSHPDIYPWQPQDPQYGLPHDPGYTPPPPPDLGDYTIRYPQPLDIHDATQAILFTAPETSLQPLVQLLAKTNSGDTILVQQLDEPPHWGSMVSSPEQDPNVRLQALIQAARRGARVRVLLDEAFDDPEDPRSNRATARMINRLAQDEALDMEARLGNPTGAGLHAKLHLITHGATCWTILTSLNGNESSHKLNREIGLALASCQAYRALAQVFQDDWEQAHPP